MIIADHCQAGAYGQEKYTPECLWPEDCYVQWGGEGVVFQNGNVSSGIEILSSAIMGDDASKEKLPQVFARSYLTAFFEAFPTNPSTFIRGEGSTINEAEQKAFDCLARFLACPGHEFERGKYRNGAGICKHCGMFSTKVFEPIDHCTVCGSPSNYTSDIDNNFWCKACAESMPEELKTEMYKKAERMLEYSRSRGSKR